MASAVSPELRHDEGPQFLAKGREFLQRSTDLKNAFAGIMKQAAALAGSDSASLFLLNATDGVLRPYLLHNLPDEYLKGCNEVPLGTQCCGRAALHKHPWVVSDMWTDPLFADCREAAKESGMRSAYSIPVMTEKEVVLGSLAFHFREPHTPSATELERGQWFAKLIAFGLNRQSA